MSAIEAMMLNRHPLERNRMAMRPPISWPVPIDLQARGAREEPAILTLPAGFNTLAVLSPSDDGDVAKW